jgi:hypothetical protein
MLALTEPKHLARAVIIGFDALVNSNQSQIHNKTVLLKNARNR